MEASSLFAIGLSNNFAPFKVLFRSATVDVAVASALLDFSAALPALALAPMEAFAMERAHVTPQEWMRAPVSAKRVMEVWMP